MATDLGITLKPGKDPESERPGEEAETHSSRQRTVTTNGMISSSAIRQVLRPADFAR